jgi:hypothetical protein
VRVNADYNCVPEDTNGVARLEKRVGNEPTPFSRPYSECRLDASWGSAASSGRRLVTLVVDPRMRLREDPLPEIVGPQPTNSGSSCRR